MSLSFDTAVQSLAGAAEAASDERLTSRLSDVQSFLGEDLRWVEQALARVAGAGVEPATDAAEHLIGLGGKRVRPTAVLLSAACFTHGAGPTHQAVREFAVVVELVHSATLLHDDVVDDGAERRGAPTARLLWGNAVSVLAGDALLVQSLRLTSQHSPQLMGALLDTLSELVSGEILQLRGRRELDLEQSTYDQILKQKTASLFRLATSAGAALAGATLQQRTALGEFGERLGMAFQLVDDVLDYSGQHSGKTLCTDLLEGKVTLPLVLAAKQDPTLLACVSEIRGGRHDLVDGLRARVVESGACEKVRQRAKQETQQALAALERIPKSSARALLQGVAQQLASRDR